MNDINQLLQQAMSTFQSGNLHTSEKICQAILSLFPKHAEAFHILALINKTQQQHQLAEKYFLKSIEFDNQQPSFYLNLANFYAQTSRATLAIEYYENAHKLSSKNLDVLYNWSVLLNQIHHYKEALTIIKKAIDINSHSAAFYNILGTANKNLTYYDAAMSAFNSSIKLDPNNFFAWHNLGVTYRILGKPNEALSCYKRVLKQGNNIPEYHFNVGCAYYDAGNIESAKKSLQKSISLNPEYVLAHETLNKLHWENAQEKSFLKSYSNYRSSIQKPKWEMLFSYAAQLIMAQRYPEATNILKDAISIHGTKAELAHALAITYLKQGVCSEDAFSLINDAIKLDPKNTRYRIDIANILIRNKEYNLALQQLEHAHTLSPLDQEIWGYKGICWRLQDDEREKWLNNYDVLVSTRKISAPSQYDNLEHFLYELKTYLKGLHSTTRQPLDQSVVGGSQTTGNLLLNSTPIIQELKIAIEENIRDYINKLPTDPTHPFLSRIKSDFKLSGCWSVLLQKKGFHTNHLHPQGWLSGPTYINVPKSINKEDPKKSGWVHFGETSLNLADKEQKALEHCPQEGECIFFPSYMWHGTNPILTDDTRMTTPCDIQPHE